MAMTDDSKLSRVPDYVHAVPATVAVDLIAPVTPYNCQVCVVDLIPSQQSFAGQSFLCIESLFLFLREENHKKIHQCFSHNKSGNNTFHSLSTKRRAAHPNIPKKNPMFFISLFCVCIPTIFLNFFYSCFFFNPIIMCYKEPTNS
jgi:hypothetical protein